LRGSIAQFLRGFYSKRFIEMRLYVVFGLRLHRPAHQREDDPTERIEGHHSVPGGRSRKYEAVMAMRLSTVPRPHASSSFARNERFMLDTMKAGATRMANTTRTPRD